MNEKMAEALNEVSDRHIEEATKQRYWWFNHLLAIIETCRKERWVRRCTVAIAAVLTLVIIWEQAAIPISLPIKAKAVSITDPSGLRGTADDEYMHSTLTELKGFFSKSMTQVLSGHNKENRVFSPINLYLALSAMAEMTGGDGQIMEALNASDLETLRQRTLELWAHCNVGTRELASSIWLDNGLSYDQQVMDHLARYHSASVYQSNLGSHQTNQDIRNWMNGMTGGLLKDSANGVDVSPNAVFALFSTIYYKAAWDSSFNVLQNEPGLFHGPDGDTLCIYMHKKEEPDPGLEPRYYYWGEDFGAIEWGPMWLILPDKDKTVDDVLAAGEWAEMVMADHKWAQAKHVYVNLKLPKFDVRDSSSLIPDLQAMGITDLFDPNRADFTAALPGSKGNAYLSVYNQATRVAIDEEGIYAASYIKGEGEIAGDIPSGKDIDFFLDRPFIFVITTGYRVPLFAGVVNEP